VSQEGQLKLGGGNEGVGYESLVAGLQIPFDVIEANRLHFNFFCITMGHGWKILGTKDKRA
jgi:hypothetical protein